LDWQPVHLRGSILVDVEVGEQGDPTLDHGEGLGDDDGAPPQSRGPMPLLGVVAFQGDRLALALVVAADRQNQGIDDITIGFVCINCA
jgi:hypothetical protein